MAIIKDRDPSNPTPDLLVNPSQIRRSIRSPIAAAALLLQRPPAVFWIVGGSAAGLFLVPALWPIMPVLLALYLLWFLSGRTNLPFRNPISWQGVDYSEPHPGIDGRFSSSGGILSLGVTGRVGSPQKGEELWITNSDARRHMVVLGTTGSGKALPLDTPVLTPHGWVANGALMPGDRLVHPSGDVCKVHSVHPQGRLPIVRLCFSDGRFSDCSLEHLWQVIVEPRDEGQQYHADLTARARDAGMLEDPESDLAKLSGAEVGERIMQACNIGILHGAYAADDAPTRCLRVSIPRPAPAPGVFPALGEAEASAAARGRLDQLSTPPDLSGAPGERARFLKCFLEARGGGRTTEENGYLQAVQPVRSAIEGRRLKSLIWSLGGDAITWELDGPSYEVRFALPAATGLPASLVGCLKRPHLEIERVKRLEASTEMSCIRTDREDGLYVIQDYICTHNTELLLGLVSQALTWSSGFLFIDGKGTRAFYARIWSLAKRFGREDDIRVLNFMGLEDADRPAGGPGSQTNTMNPFSKGSSDNLMNLVVSLMGDTGGSGDMWKSRAMGLVSAGMKVLVEMRDAGDLLLNVQAIRDYMPLGEGFSKSLLGPNAGSIESLDQVPEAAWTELRARTGMTELYLRSLRGEFSNSSRLALKGFFDSLPGFQLRKALNGVAQDGKASEQYNFLLMQTTKPLGSLADDFGHIFRTPLGEVDIEDCVLNRRILIALLPALQKAEEEQRNCGRIIVSNLKMCMAAVSGATLQGAFEEIIEADQTRSPSPFVCVLDEVGYYMVAGIDVMMAQARSLGFMIVLAGQDMAAMQKGGPEKAQIAETAFANASCLAIGKTVDGGKTMDYIAKVVGEAQIAVASGYQAHHGLLGTRYMDRQDVTFQATPRLKVQDLQNLPPGQFYVLFDSKLELTRSFYVGEDFAPDFSVNRFLKVRGPLDRVPGLDQSVEIEFGQGLEDTAAAIAHSSPPSADDDGGLDRASPEEVLLTRYVDAVAAAPLEARTLTGLDVLAAEPMTMTARDRHVPEIHEHPSDDAAASGTTSFSPPTQDRETREERIQRLQREDRDRMQQRRNPSAGKVTTDGVDANTKQGRVAPGPDSAADDLDNLIDGVSPGAQRRAKKIDAAFSGQSASHRYGGILGLMLEEQEARKAASMLPPRPLPADETTEVLEGIAYAMERLGEVIRDSQRGPRMHVPSAPEHGHPGGAPTDEHAARGRALLNRLKDDTGTGQAG